MQLGFLFLLPEHSPLRLHVSEGGRCRSRPSSGRRFPDLLRSRRGILLKGVGWGSLWREVGMLVGFAAMGLIGLSAVAIQEEH